MQCPHCGQEHSDSSRFCPTSGKKLDALPVCPNCSKEIQDNWQVCGHCGKRLSKPNQAKLPWQTALQIALWGIAVVLFIALVLWIGNDFFAARETTPEPAPLETSSLSSTEATQQRKTPENIEISFTENPAEPAVRTLPNADFLFPILDIVAGKWGYINNQGDLVISPKFQNARPFSEGLALVQDENLWGFIDKTGEYAIYPQFLKAASFSEGLAQVGVERTGFGTSYGYIDPSGKFIIEPSDRGGTFQDFGDQSFSEGFAITVGGSSLGGNSFGVNFIDTAGNRLMDFRELYSAKPFSEGLASVIFFDSSTDIGERGFIDSKGEIVFLHNYTLAHSFSEGMAAVMGSPGAKWGYINKTGQLTIDFQFSEAREFSEGLAPVREPEEDLWGYVDQSGNLAIQQQFQQAYRFSDGLAAVKTDDGLWGYIDQNGSFQIGPKFVYAENFTNGLASVMEDHNSGGYIDSSGRYIWQHDRGKLLTPEP